MKKTMIWLLMMSFLLAGCGKGQTETGNMTSDEGTAAVNESTEAIGGPTVPSEEETEPVLETEEAEREKLVPLNVEISAKYEGEWDDQGPIITADSATIHILDEGLDTLKNNLNVYNEMNWQEVFSSYIEHRAYANADLYAEGSELYISREIEVKRADNKILSFVNTETSYVGGAHGNYYENAEVFDTQKGRVLELTDVITDYDAMYQYIVTYLKENYDEERFFEEYEEWLEQMFYEPDAAMASPIEWFITMDGIEFIFNPYVIGPWSSGTIRVKMPYEGHEEMFVEEYVSHVERPIRTVKTDEKIVIDADRDGHEETFVLTAVPNEETYMTELTITKYLNESEENPGEYEGKSERTFEFGGTFKRAYLAFGQNEQVYLYVEFLGDSDFQTTEIFNLSDVLSKEGNETDLGENLYIEGIDKATYGHFISDSEQFSLYSRIYTLGTYMGYKTYYVGEDGTPFTDETMYRLVNPGMSWETTLVSSRALNVQMHEDGGDAVKETTLPKGTVFKPLRTDGVSVVEMELEDGRICDILLEKPEDGGAYLINGINEFDCFENLPYAG